MNNVRAQFDTLVRDLDKSALDELRRSIAAEMEERRLQTALSVEDIHPGMTAAEKDQVAREIARVLRGDA